MSELPSRRPPPGVAFTDVQRVCRDAGEVRAIASPASTCDAHFDGLTRPRLTSSKNPGPVQAVARPRTRCWSNRQSAGVGCSRTPHRFMGEGYLESGAKLRVERIRTSQERVRRLMREHRWFAGHAHGPRQRSPLPRDVSFARITVVQIAYEALEPKRSDERCDRGARNHHGLRTTWLTTAFFAGV